MTQTNNKSFQPLLLVVEDIFTDFEIIKEQVQGASCKNAIRFKIKGPYFLMEEVNANHHSYPKEIAIPVYENYVENKVKRACALGELEHSDIYDINLKNVCHNITDLKIDGNHWIGESEILTGHPCGDMLSSLISHKCRFGVSSRSAGSFNNDKTIVEKFFLSAFDVVANPSITKFVDGILQEKEFFINKHGIIVESAFNGLEQQIQKLPHDSKEKQDHILSAIQSFLRSL